MATAASAAKSPWRTARIVEIRPETASAKTFRFALDEPAPPESSSHRAGQHYVVRLRAPDGYTAARSYSIASAPDGSNEFELTIERLEGGEVSTFLHDDAIVGDELEIRGPIGGWFVWDGEPAAVLVGGGSGVVPLMAMLRLARRIGKSDRLRLVVSVRTPADLYYATEIVGPETTLVYTRTAPDASPRRPGRLSVTDIPQPLVAGTRGYVCGSSGFADAASAVLIASGIPTDQIRVERFGPSG